MGEDFNDSRRGGGICDGELDRFCGVLGWTTDTADDAATGEVFEGAMVHTLYPFDPWNRW